MRVWPTTLPQYINQGGYSEQRVDGKLVTAMDSGPTITRSLFSATPVTYSVELTLTSVQVDTLDLFYYTTCKNGVLPFLWMHPRNHTATNIRFTSVPSIKGKSHDTFNVSFSMEILP